jgi:mxaJ protein
LVAGVEAFGKELRVCADPNNLPFSNQRLEGFENKIADLIAEDLGATIRYTWHPQRRGFIRRTLKARECDVVMGVPSSYELVLATKPYYSSSYVFVYPKHKGYGIQSFDDPVLRDIKIGLHALGDDGFNPPPAHALARRGITGNVVGFNMWDADSVENPPGKIIEAVASGEIDTAIVWGPIGGFYAQRQAAQLNVVPVSPASDSPSLPFVFPMSMGVRHDDRALKESLERIIEHRKADIDRILRDYGIPLVGSEPR